MSYSTWMGSYRTLDGELLHAGWVKRNAGDAAGSCRNISGKIRYTSIINRQISTFLEISNFVSETSIYHKLDTTMPLFLLLRWLLYLLVVLHLCWQICLFVLLHLFLLVVPHPLCCHCFICFYCFSVSSFLCGFCPREVRATSGAT